MKNLVPTSRPVLDFAPVPRKYRYDGWTADRQRAFVAALAETGSVKAAAQRINMSADGAYYLRRQPGAEDFAAAWAQAIDHGVQSLVDIAIERAREGIAVPVYWKGEQVGERRWYNDRLLMFILRHHLPGKYGALAALPPGTRHPDTIAREAAEAEAAEAAAETEAEAEAEESAQLNDQLLKRYELKARAERRHRLAGEVIAADFTLRQLTHIELILDIGGRTMRMIDLATGFDEKGRKVGTDPEPFASDISAMLAQIRQEAWDTEAAPPRPALPLHRRTVGTSSLQGGDTRRDREKAQRAAAARIAEAQAEWEAVATEEGWEVWLAGR